MYDREQLKKWGGADSNVRIKYNPPIIKFNGAKGKFTLVEKDGDKYKAPVDLPDTLEVTILRPRRSCGWYEKNAKGESINYFTREHNGYLDKLTLFCSENNGKAKVIDEGTSSELYEKYQLLRTSANLYMLYNGAVHKLKIKGVSGKAFREYRDSLAKDQKYLFDFATLLTIKKEDGAAFDFYSVAFTAGFPTDFEKVGPFIEEVGTVMDRIDEQFAVNELNRQSSDVDQGGGYQEPIVDVDEDEAPEEIKVENIPF